VDELLHHHAGAAALSVPQLGTVTATAVRLALQITTGQVFLAGVDLASWDVLSHARGHVFNEYHAAVATRLHPLPTTRVSRLAESAIVPDLQGNPWRSAHDLSIYAAWFRSVAETQRLRRLAPSAVDLGVPEAHAQELIRQSEARAPRGPLGSPASVPPRSARFKQLAGLIESWTARTEAFHPRRNAELAQAPSPVMGLARHLAMAEVLRTQRAAPEGTEEILALRHRLRAALERARTFLEMQRESIQ
jgi:hypothetical protein